MLSFLSVQLLAFRCLLCDVFRVLEVSQLNFVWWSCWSGRYFCHSTRFSHTWCFSRVRGVGHHVWSVSTNFAGKQSFIQTPRTLPTRSIKLIAATKPLKFSSDGPRQSIRPSGAITKALRSSRTVSVQFQAFSSNNPNKNCRKVEPNVVFPWVQNVCNDWVCLFGFKLNFMLILGHHKGECACNQSAPGAWGKCFRKRQGRPNFLKTWQGLLAIELWTIIVVHGVDVKCRGKRVV